MLRYAYWLERGCRKLMKRVDGEGSKSKIVDAELTILRSGERGQVQARIISKAAIRHDGSVTLVCTLRDILAAFLEEEKASMKGTDHDGT